jgi:hypothetical protein
MKKTGLRACMAVAVFLFFALSAYAQSGVLAVSGNKPVVDATITDGEYSFQKDFGQMALSLSRSADTLYIGAAGKTSGWIAVGLGSMKMNGASIFIGYVGTDGKPQFKPQIGEGHRHKDPSGKDMNDEVISYAMKEEGGKTFLELALKSDAFIKEGQKTLDVIFAIGPAKAFTPYHKYRNFTEVKLVP